MSPRLHVAMVAYANYYTDARIKNYVDALLERGDSVDVYALGGNEPPPNNPHLRVFDAGHKEWSKSTLSYVMAQGRFLAWAAARLARNDLAERYDLIHVHNMPNSLVMAGLPLKLHGAKLILDVHDTMPEAYATKFDYALDSAPIRFLVLEERLSASCADHVITTNSMHKSVLVRHGTPARKISEVLNVANEKIFYPTERRRIPDELWLGYHGTISERLGVFLIAEALALLNDECPGLRFLCVGEGDDLDEMKRRARELGVADRIEFVPFVLVESLPKVLDRVEVGIIGNGRETEAKQNYMLPVKMLEYAAMEVPTIAPSLKIIESYFDEGNAIFYEPDSVMELSATIRRVYSDRDEIQRRVPGLRVFNQKYNWRTMAKRYLQLVDGLVTSNSGAGYRVPAAE